MSISIITNQKRFVLRYRKEVRATLKKFCLLLVPIYSKGIAPRTMLTAHRLGVGRLYSSILKLRSPYNVHTHIYYYFLIGYQTAYESGKPFWTD